MPRIVQIVPAVHADSGVEGVAYHLEREFCRAGMTTERFTLTEAWGDWLPQPGAGVPGKLALAARVGWFSTVGTALARRYLRARPDAVGLCHNDALAGDVYVNHGILTVAMRARGGFAWRMVRNPMHLFIALRDAHRYRSGTHRVVVNLTAAEDAALRAEHPRLRPRTVVIGNGVDVERFRPPTPRERAEARMAVGLSPADVAIVFVGHEFDRKGLPLILEALVGAPESLCLVVVGGTPDLVEAASVRAAALGVGDRVRFVGRASDPVPYFHAADVFALPSAYESYGLVVLEAMACGLPVVASAVGCVPEVVADGDTGLVVEREPTALRSAFAALVGADRAAWGRRARAEAERHSWEAVARQYATLAAEVASERSAERRGTGAVRRPRARGWNSGP